MKIFRTSDDIVRVPKLVLGIGTFDGVHLGHQAILNTVLARAGRTHGTPGILTFHPHPLSVVSPTVSPRLILSLEHRLAVIERLGIALAVVWPFTQAFSSQEPEQFVRDVLWDRLGVETLVAGETFRFGRGARGDIRLLRSEGARLGIAVEEVLQVRQDGVIVSSTAIRQAIERGDLAVAQRFLGRPVSVMGRVVRGDGRGASLGIPTANIEVSEEVSPPHGVYAVSALIRERRWQGVANVGHRPTFEHAAPRLIVEAHVFGFEGTLYGDVVEIEFLEKLRDERKFSTAQDLVRQISRDIQAAKSFFTESRPC